MSKTESLIIKGLAIILMVFLHLFNQMKNCEICINFIHINNLPLIHILTRAANPVSFYLLLSGIGLYSSYKKGNSNLKTNIKRLIKLYIHYWIILLIFIIIGAIILPNIYPNNLATIIGNFTSFNTTYNGECWFLFPYALILLSSSFILKMIDRYNHWIILLASFIININTSYLISRYGEQYLYNDMWIYNPVLFLHLLFPFIFGAVCAKSDFWNTIKKLRQVNSHIIWLGLLILIIIRCFTTTSIVQPFFAYIVIICFVSTTRCKLIDSILTKLGANSMNIWMIHTWFCYYLFHDFIYSFKYPIIIFLITLSLSYFTSITVNQISKFITTKLA